jgi:hypothetical protein
LPYKYKPLLYFPLSFFCQNERGSFKSGGLGDPTARLNFLNKCHFVANGADIYILCELRRSFKSLVVADTVPGRLKINKYVIIRAWMLLIFFAAGQVVIYAHQHPSSLSNAGADSHSSSKQVFTEKCSLCDAMHFNHMDIVHAASALPVAAGSYVYIRSDYNFITLSLILAAGRSPPLV